MSKGVVVMPKGNDLLALLISLYSEQENVRVTYELEEES